MEKLLTFCALRQTISGPQWQLQRSQLFAIFPPAAVSRWPALLLSPHHHIPEEEHVFLLVRLFGVLLIKYSTHKILNKYIAASDAVVPYTPTWRAICIYIWNIMESYLLNAKQATEWFSSADLLLITRVQSTPCTHTHMHTHALAHARSLLGTRVLTLHNLSAWEMFILISHIHLGGGRSPRCIGLNSTRLLQAVAWKRFCLQGPTAWCGRGGEGGILGLSSPRSSAGAHGQELELRGRLMLECKSENVSG